MNERKESLAKRRPRGRSPREAPSPSEVERLEGLLEATGVMLTPGSAMDMEGHLRIGYNRAARLLEAMEKAGLVSPMQSNGNRDILAPARVE